MTADDDGGAPAGDAGALEPDAGSTDAGGVDAGAFDAGGPPAPCGAVQRAPYCTGTSDDAWCWVAPLPFLPIATAVWANDCNAFAAGDDGWLFERAPSGWRPLPRVAHRTIRAFAAFAPDEAWAVGDEGTVLRFDGRAFEPVSHTRSVDFLAAYAPSRGVVYLAARDGVYRCEGPRHAERVTEVLSAPRTTFTGISGDGVRLRAVGTELIPNVDRPAVVWSFDGSSWVKERQLTMVTLNDVVHHAGQFFVVGAMNAHGPEWGVMAALDPYLMHSTQQPGVFTGIAKTASGRLGVVGQGAFPVSVFDGQFGGVRDAPAARFLDISGAADDFFVAGDVLGRITSRSFLAETDVPREPATSVVTGSGEVWLSGGLRSRSGLAFQATTTQLALGPVVGVPPARLWSIAQGVVHRFDGINWSAVAAGPTDTVHSLAWTQRDELWAWGNTSLWKYANGAWARINVPASSWSISDVWAPPTGETLMVGQFDGQAKLYATNGARFAEFSPAPPVGLRLVRGRAARDLFAITDDGHVLRFDGQTWLETDGGMTGKARALAVKGGHVVMAGDKGLVGWWTGMRFAIEPIGSAASLFAVAIDDAEGEWAVGAGGAVLHKRRGLSGP